MPARKDGRSHLRPYYVLLTRDYKDGPWCIEFGSFIRTEVHFERDDYHLGYRGYSLENLKVLKCASERQPDIDEAIRAWRSFEKSKGGSSHIVTSYRAPKKDRREH